MLRQKCKVCGKQGMVTGIVEELHHRGYSLGLFRVERCSSCGEVVYPPEAWQKIRYIEALSALPPNHTVKAADATSEPISAIDLGVNRNDAASDTVPFRMAI